MYIQHNSYIIFGFQVHIAFHDFFPRRTPHCSLAFTKQPLRMAHACAGYVQVLLHNASALGLFLEQHFFVYVDRSQITPRELRHLA